MFGLNILNPFSLGDTIDTSTIIWLRIFLFSTIVISSYVAYNSTTKWITYAMYITIGISIFLFLWYLNTGSVFPGAGGSCTHCPGIGDDTRFLKSGTVVSTNVPTPPNNPYNTTHLYYFVIQDSLGKDLGKSLQDEKGNMLIDWKEYYRIGLDRTTSTLYFRTYAQSPTDSVRVSKMPYGTLVQIAVVQNQKTFAICVNGERKITVRSPRLPISSSLTRSPTVNGDGIISNGVLYHMEIHNTILDTPDLQRHRESVLAVYSNSSIFQNTPLPSSNAKVGIVERVRGYARVSSNRFSYPKIVNTGLNSLQEQNE